MAPHQFDRHFFKHVTIFLLATQHFLGGLQGHS